MKGAERGEGGGWGGEERLETRAVSLWENAFNCFIKILELSCCGCAGGKGRSLAYTGASAKS